MNTNNKYINKYIKKKQYNFPNALKYFFAFLGLMMIDEVLIRLLTRIESTELIAPFIFMPAIALFLSALCGFAGNVIDRILFYLFTSLLYIFYVSQLIYHTIFGSFYSVSMVSIGPDAITNFSTALIDVLLSSILNMLILLIPVLICIGLDVLFHLRRKEELFASKQTMLSRGICLLLVIPVWVAGVGLLKLSDNGNRSAYAIYRNSLTDTDTSASKLGVLPTAVVEARAYFFGLGADGAAAVISESDKTNPDKLNDLLSELQQHSQTQTPSPSPTTTPPAEPSPTAESSGTPLPTPTPTEVPRSYNYWCYDNLDFNELASVAPNDEIKALCEYLATVEPTNKNEYTGIFEGYNLVYICAEAFWTYAINEKATPTLYKLANNGIVLTNYYNSFLNTTINGEFAFATSLWPDISRKADAGRATGSFACTVENYMPYGLGNLFRDQLGANSYGFHNYLGSYYIRNQTWPNLGYKTKFMDEGDGTGMVFTSDWITSDLEMMEQAVDDFINEDIFHAYFMTFSGHGPYCGKIPGYDEYNANAVKNINMVRNAVGDTIKDWQALYYIAANAELDKALEYLINRLEEAGKLDKTLIVLTADHFPYYMDYSAETKAALAGRTLDKETEIYKSTCIIYNSGVKEPIVNDVYCSNVDILPTVLNLLNIKFDSRLLAGRDVFSNSMHKAVLYNKSFITDYATYYSVKDKTTWKIDTSTISEETLSEYISSICALIDKEYAASLQIVNTDFYRFVWDNMKKD